MGLEEGNLISQLVQSDPTGVDDFNQGDDHLRLIKRVLKNTFPGKDSQGFAKQITSSEDELNYLVGARKNIQFQIDELDGGGSSLAQQVDQNTADISSQGSAINGNSSAISSNSSAISGQSGQISSNSSNISSNTSRISSLEAQSAALLIRGTFNDAGTVTSGSGFSVTKQGTGQYLVVSQSSLGTGYVISASATANVIVASQSSTSFLLYSYAVGTANLANPTQMHFSVLKP